MTRYRVLTTDGFILYSCENFKEARSRAIQQSKRLREKIVIKRFDRELDEYTIQEFVSAF